MRRSTQQPKERVLDLRWMREDDIKQVLEIERQSFDDPWDEKTLRQCVNGHRVNEMVIAHGDIIAGFIIYQRHATRIDVLNVAVKQDYRRMMIGTAMLDHLKTKLCDRVTMLRMDVVDNNLEAQLWLRENEFKCNSILREKHEDLPGVNVYRFEFAISQGKGE